MSRSEAIALVGFCLAIGAACIATHSSDPLWFLILLILFR